MSNSTPPPRLGIAAEAPQLPRTDTKGEQPPEAARWSAAEDRLYPLVMADPDLYQAAVTLVREVLDVLRSQCATVAELSSIDPAEVLRQCPTASALPPLDLDLGVVLDSARAYRWRDLVADQIDADEAATPHPRVIFAPPEVTRIARKRKS
jgi:hypothetical protein